MLQVNASSLKVLQHLQPSPFSDQATSIDDGDNFSVFVIQMFRKAGWDTAGGICEDIICEKRYQEAP